MVGKEMLENLNQINASNEFVERFLEELSKDLGDDNLLEWYSENEIKSMLLNTTILHSTLTNKDGEYVFTDDIKSYKEWLECEFRNSLISHYESEYNFIYPQYLFDEYLAAAKKYYKKKRKKNKAKRLGDA